MAEEGSVWKDRGHFRYNLGHLGYLPDSNLEYSKQEGGVLTRVAPEPAK